MIFEFDKLEIFDEFDVFVNEKNALRSKTPEYQINTQRRKMLKEIMTWRNPAPGGMLVL